MSDWCIENDFAAQKEIAEREEDTIYSMKVYIKSIQSLCAQYKEALEKIREGNLCDSCKENTKDWEVKPVGHNKQSHQCAIEIATEALAQYRKTF